MSDADLYRDFSDVKADDMSKVRAHHGDLEPHTDKFPYRLHYVLSELAKEGREDVAGWSLHGRSFSIRDKATFEREQLPLWFRQSSYASFQRQLNMYGFKRIASGPDAGTFYHELFLRGKSYLAGYIRHKPKGGRRGRKKAAEVPIDLSIFPPLHEEEASATNTGGVESQGVNRSQGADSGAGDRKPPAQKP